MPLVFWRRSSTKNRTGTSPWFTTWKASITLLNPSRAASRHLRGPPGSGTHACHELAGPHGASLRQTPPTGRVRPETLPRVRRVKMRPIDRTGPARLAQASGPVSSLRQEIAGHRSLAYGQPARRPFRPAPTPVASPGQAPWCRTIGERLTDSTADEDERGCFCPDVVAGPGAGVISGSGVVAGDRAMQVGLKRADDLRRFDDRSGSVPGRPDDFAVAAAVPVISAGAYGRSTS